MRFTQTDDAFGINRPCVWGKQTICFQSINAPLKNDVGVLPLRIHKSALDRNRLITQLHPFAERIKINFSLFLFYESFNPA